MPPVTSSGSSRRDDTTAGDGVALKAHASGPTPAHDPARLEALVNSLPRRVSYLSRVLYRTDGSSLPRAMRSAVFTLAFGPMRITDLAWQEGIGQPAATRMVARLEALGLVRRERSETDGRIVMVALTDAGLSELDRLREQSRRLIRAALRTRSVTEIRRLEAASEALDQLTDWALEEEIRIHEDSAQRLSAAGAPSRQRLRRAAHP